MSEPTTGQSSPVLRLNRRQSREVDRLSIHEYHMPTLLLMENAARSAADVAWDMLGRAAGRKVVVVCGTGDNGGDGFAVARHLHNRCVCVDLRASAASAVEKSSEAYRMMRQIAESMGLVVTSGQAVSELPADCGDLIIDGLFGTGLSRALEGEWAALVSRMNSAGVPILALDLPSGLDCDTGMPTGPACVRATKTVTFATEKIGFANPNSSQYTGAVLVGDIGCPREAIERAARV